MVQYILVVLQLSVKEKWKYIIIHRPSLMILNIEIRNCAKMRKILIISLRFILDHLYHDVHIGQYNCSV